MCNSVSICMCVCVWETDPCDSAGFILLMLACIGFLSTDGSGCLLFWWRSSRSRPRSSHHEDSNAKQTQTHINWVIFDIWVMSFDVYPWCPGALFLFSSQKHVLSSESYVHFQLSCVLIVQWTPPTHPPKDKEKAFSWHEEFTMFKNK